MLSVNERRRAARTLRARNRVQGDRGLTGRLGAVNLNDAALGESAHAERHIKGEAAGGDYLDGRAVVVAQAHDGALAELLVDLRERGVERLLLRCQSCAGRFRCL